MRHCSLSIMQVIRMVSFCGWIQVRIIPWAAYQMLTKSRERSPGWIQCVQKGERQLGLRFNSATQPPQPQFPSCKIRESDRNLVTRSPVSLPAVRFYNSMGQFRNWGWTFPTSCHGQERKCCSWRVLAGPLGGARILLCDITISSPGSTLAEKQKVTGGLATDVLEVDATWWS